jgi:CubicO group peptidase (beta-lactamase class C family)
MSSDFTAHGSCHDDFEPLRQAFVDNFVHHDEIGAALCVYQDGECVTDLWAGHADAEIGTPWEADTVTYLFSTTKGLTATCANMLIDRGHLDPEARAARYWPEFAQAGKADVTVAWLLSHRAGLPKLDAPLALDEALLWTPMVDALARQKPWWTPGTAHGYHAQTFGWLIGELVRRIDGRTVGTFLADEVARPLRLDLQIGLPESEHHRLARLVVREAPATIGRRAKTTPVTSPAIDPMDPRVYSAEIPSSNGVGTARSIARLYSALIDPPAGIELLSRTTLAAATQEQACGLDRTLQAPTRFGLGYGLPSETFPLFGAASFGHGGKGGSLAFADPECHIALGYTPNHLYTGYSRDPRYDNILGALRHALGQSK